jgi:hypothetical protein
MHCRGWAMPCDRRHSPTVRSCQELARICRKQNHSCQCLSSSRYVDGIKVLAEQFNQSVLAMVRKAAERVSPAETLGNRRRLGWARHRGDLRWRWRCALPPARQACCSVVERRPVHRLVTGAAGPAGVPAAVAGNVRWDVLDDCAKSADFGFI